MNKGHHKSKRSVKATKRPLNLDKDPEAARKRNPKAFAIQNVGKTERRIRRKNDLDEKRKRLPQIDRTPIQVPPIVVAVVGPPKVGKSTLIKGLIKNFTRQNLVNIQGKIFYSHIPYMCTGGREGDPPP